MYNSPFDVRLTKNIGLKDKETETVVQPDIIVVCNTSILDDRGCSAAPELIVEILSQSTLKKDFNEIFNLYEENGVKEYWLVHLELQTVETYVLVNDKFELNLRYENAKGIITSPQLTGFSLDCKSIFDY